METNKDFIGTYFRILKVLYIAILAGLLFLGAIMLYLVISGKVPAPDLMMKKIMMVIIPVFAFGSVCAGIILFRKDLRKIRMTDGLVKKMNAYRSAMIKRYVFMEAAYFFGIVVFYLTSSYYFIIFPLAVLLLFIFFRPNKNLLIKDMELSPSEVAQISEKESRTSE